MKFRALPVIDREVLLKRTKGRCPVCHAPCPAEVWRVEGTPAKVFLKRICVTHGEASVCIASDARFYWLAKGDSENASAVAAARLIAALHRHRHSICEISEGSGRTRGRQRGRVALLGKTRAGKGRLARSRNFPPASPSSKLSIPVIWPAPRATRIRPSVWRKRWTPCR